MGSHLLALLAGSAILGASMQSCMDAGPNGGERRVSAWGQDPEGMPEGTLYTLKVRERVDETGQKVPVTPETLNRVMQALHARLDPHYRRGVQLRPHQDDQIVIGVPPLDASESSSVLRAFEAPGKLELRAVHPESSTLALRVKEGETIIPGYQHFEYQFTTDDGEKRTEHLLLSKRIEVEGKHVKFAAPDAGQKGVVNIRLSREGGERMIRLTKEMVPGRNRIAVVLDGEVMSAPVVQSVPLGSQFIIEGLDSYEEATDLSIALLNPLSNPLEILQVKALAANPSDPDESSTPDNHPETNSD